MAYSRNNTPKNVTATISINSPDISRTCKINKIYTETTTISKNLDTTDTFEELLSFQQAKGSLKVSDTKAILIRNIGRVGAEIFLSTQSWKNNSNTDAKNSDDLGLSGARIYRVWTWLLPVGEAFYLPNNRVIAYEEATGGTYESGANASNGSIEILTSAINSDLITKDSAADLKSSGAGADNVTNPATFTLDTNHTLYLKVGDAINIDSEVMVITSLVHGSHTITVNRGMFGSDIASHADGTGVSFWFGNQHKIWKAGTQKLTTDHYGKFKSTGAFFGYSRTSDRIADGIVPGSVAIGPFFILGGYLDFGMVVGGSDKHGLTAGTEYSFTLLVDDYHVDGLGDITYKQEIKFTPDASDTTFNTGKNSLIPKIQTAIDEQLRNPASPIYQMKVIIGISDGDLRIQTQSNHSGTRIGINSTTTTTTPFSVGRFPNISSSSVNVRGEQVGTSSNICMFGPKSRLADETYIDQLTSIEKQNIGAFILDSGNGALINGNSGSTVGTIDYERGHISFSSYPNAEFKIWGQSHSAHSGGTELAVVGGVNGLQSIKGRSVNSAIDAKIEIDILS